MNAQSKPRRQGTLTLNLKATAPGVPTPQKTREPTTKKTRTQLYAENVAVLRILQTRFPLAFEADLKKKGKPLAIGIFEALRSVSPDIGKKRMRRALRLLTSSRPYLQSLAEPESVRVDLTGTVTTAVTDYERTLAIERLNAIARRRCTTATQPPGQATSGS
ncbi:ProQ/FinO family protein [Phaeobacter marinintestinus]|uniref:ProQ/FinO family protein n=1 Tax=Falsiphaeobacter marinintestinus TaxID=1492905 RepID=UPI003CCC6449